MHKKSKAAVLAALAIVSAASVAGCGAASDNRTASSATTTTSVASKSQKTTKNGQITTKTGSTTVSASDADGTTIAVNPSEIHEGTTEDTVSEDTSRSDVGGDFSQDIAYAFNNSDPAGVSAGDSSGSNGVSYSAGDDQESAVFGNVSGNSKSSVSTDAGNMGGFETASSSSDSTNASSDVTKSTHIVHHDAITHEEVIPATYTTIHHDATYTTVHHDAVTHEETVPGRTYFDTTLPDVDGATVKVLCWPGSTDMEPSPDQYSTTNIFWRTGERQNGTWTFNDSAYKAWNRSLGTNWSMWGGGEITLPSTTQTVVDQEAYDEQVVDQPAWDEQVVDVPEHTITVTDQEAWDEVVSD